MCPHSYSQILVEARFILDVIDVDPIQTLSDVASSLNEMLQNTDGPLGDIVSSFGSSLGSVSEVFDEVTNSSNVKLALDALLDVSVRIDLSLDNFDFDVQVNELAAGLNANIGGNFSFDVGDYFVGIRSSLEMNLEAVNTATPFLLNVSDFGDFTQFDYTGDFDSLVSVGVQGIPAEISLRASSDELVSKRVTLFHYCIFSVIMFLTIYPHKQLANNSLI